ncbi:unnamed protein product [Didymodactylos carnosus]|uniref:MAM domain-containing protein n=1 Tax=Didymodactylos carnosus TaxID=1234261 RepID=A0A815EFB2_9BILA|nr:unnamed protein product [Didymodactylos carnosus]CAF4147785.1 unnamed protein product [Didymodactylos carnosus]
MSKSRFISLALTSGLSRSWYISVDKPSTTVTQCLRYYYYLTNSQSGLSITARIVSANGNTTIDQVTYVPVNTNGWNYQYKTFESVDLQDNRLYFDLQRPTGTGILYIALDEISIEEGRCTDDLSSSSTQSNTDTTESPVIFTGTTIDETMTTAILATDE